MKVNRILRERLPLDTTASPPDHWFRLETATRFLLLGALQLGLAQANESPLAEKEATAWAKEQAIILDSVESQSDLTDLEPVKEIVGDASIVALGECTHGTREIFQMKHRMVEFLATTMGFNLFAIEANMPEAQRLNAYVMGSEGDARELIRGMYFWTWSTEEVYDLVEWMRDFNKDPENQAVGRSIGFTGFDMQTPEVAAETVRAFAELNDPDLLPEVNAAIETIRKGDRFGCANGMLPLERVKGRDVSISGWIKTEALEGGWAGFWCRADSAEKTGGAFENMQSEGPSGTTPWTHYALQISVPIEATGVFFGLLMPGRGTSWFDGVEVRIDGELADFSDLYDLTFEEATIRGFTRISQDSYKVTHSSDAKVGRQSLQIKGESDSTPAEEGILAWRKIGEDLKAANGNKEELAWVRQNARIVEQALTARTDPRSRDRFMADNVAWLHEQNPDSKIILWAHNGHIARHPGAMGRYLDEVFPDSMCVIGFSVGKGQYRARELQTPKQWIHELSEPAPGSIEEVFFDTDLPLFVLDLRASRTADPDSPAGWFNAERPHRTIGAVAMSDQFRVTNIARDYDAVIWIENTSPTRSFQPQ